MNGVNNMNDIDFLNKAKAINHKLVEWRRDFHMHPELGYEEVRTSGIVKEFLDGLGIEFHECAKTGICAIIRGKGDRTIGLRADMDALPLMEKDNKEYSSKVPGKMHACGHDAHTAILMGAAMILNDMKDELNGNVKLFFEPAEETTGGARLMVEEGVLENPRVDAVIGLHVDERIECGKIGVKRGIVNAASNEFNIRITGRGGHGAQPNATVDPIVISANVITALQSIVAREIAPTSPAVLTIGRIHGGTANNIIPESVEIGGILRTMTPEEREYAKKRLTEVAAGVAETMRGKAEVDMIESYPCLHNDDQMASLLISSADKVISQDKIEILKNPSMGVESFAYFSMERPSAFYYLGTRNENKGTTCPAHNVGFDIDEDALAIGVAVQCATVFDFLNGIS